MKKPELPEKVTEMNPVSSHREVGTVDPKGIAINRLIDCVEYLMDHKIMDDVDLKIQEKTSEHLEDMYTLMAREIHARRKEWELREKEDAKKRKLVYFCCHALMSAHEFGDVFVLRDEWYVRRKKEGRFFLKYCPYCGKRLTVGGILPVDDLKGYVDPQGNQDYTSSGISAQP